MKLLFTFFNPSGGMETLNRIRCHAFMKMDVECHLLYSLDGEGRKNIKDIPTFVMNDEASIGKLIQRQNYDAIVVCTDVTMLLTIKKAGFKGHLIFEIQGLGTLQTASAVLKDISARVLQAADGVLYPQTSHLQELMTAYLHGIPHFCFDDPLDTECFGYSSYPPKPFPIIGWVGRIEANKNWREFLLIGSRMLQKHPEGYLWIFGDTTLGDPAEKEHYDRWVNGLQLQHKLIVYSNIPHEQIADYFSVIGDSGGFLCSTSILEGFGYAVAEAMLCRCPVLTTDSDGIRRFLIHDVTGKLYARGNVNQAVVQGESLMKDTTLRNTIRKNAEKHIKQHFSSEKYTTNFMNMLKSLSQRKPKY
ncbi:glycosyltransferase family 4 protein [Paenibacillus lignilyticus]|uniref:Glycosyltransferase family 4 protein n=1 Tax=Paenibacillus lignilyticus TaxID=1172615 RepID=A0ABS5CM90_9BACL|nr:glycosyltransferase family 4 protein [Paenibacillus lignilyticus]MBP3966990.1 glycosyltransferase family 4 protein [Paenibacillus lignilyticus]